MEFGSSRKHSFGPAGLTPPESTSTSPEPGPVKNRKTGSFDRTEPRHIEEAELENDDDDVIFLFKNEDKKETRECATSTEPESNEKILESFSQTFQKLKIDNPGALKSIICELDKGPSMPEIKSPKREQQKEYLDKSGDSNTGTDISTGSTSADSSFEMVTGIDSGSTSSETDVTQIERPKTADFGTVG